LHTALLQTLDRLNMQGEVFDGEVRYLLVRGAGVNGPSLWSMPGSLPLGDPEDVAIDETSFQSYQRGTSLRASGAEADALHELWRQMDAFEISGRTPGVSNSGASLIPIEVGTTRYQLIVRDSVPLEDANGLIDY